MLRTDPVSVSAPEAPVPGPSRPAGLRGHLDIEAARRADGRTVLARQDFRAPFHLGKPYWDGRVLHAQLVNPTAGILSGDRLDLSVCVAAGAALRLTTPAATRAFMMGGEGAACRQQFVVADGGWLEYAPEPLCPHAGSDYAQSTRIEMTANAEVFWVDTLAPGRVGRGERWAWRRLRLGLDVVREGEPLLRERLDACGADFARAAAFHGTPAGWLATILLLTPRLDAIGEAADRVRALDAGGTWLGLTRLRRGGWIARAIAPDGQAMRDLLAEVRDRLAPVLPLLAVDARRV